MTKARKEDKKAILLKLAKMMNIQFLDMKNSKGTVYRPIKAHGKTASQLQAAIKGKSWFYK